MESLRPFNKSTKADIWQPGILTLGISAAKFVDLDKNGKLVKPDAGKSSLLMKYFNNATVKANGEDTKVVKGQIEELVEGASGSWSGNSERSENQPNEEAAATSGRSSAGCNQQDESGLDADQLNCSDDAETVEIEVEAAASRDG